MTNFFNALGNSAMVTTATVVLTLLTNSLVAYAIARNMNRKFFKGLYFYFISAMFIPFPIIIAAGEADSRFQYDEPGRAYHPAYRVCFGI